MHPLPVAFAPLNTILFVAATIKPTAMLAKQVAGVLMFSHKVLVLNNTLKINDL
jgi:hypothetical protein